jgi:hypothetical protein
MEGAPQAAGVAPAPAPAPAAGVGPVSPGRGRAGQPGEEGRLVPPPVTLAMLWRV